MKYGLALLLLAAMLLSGCTVSLPWQSRQEISAQEVLQTADEQGISLNAEDMYSAGFRFEQEGKHADAILMYNTLLVESITRELRLRTYHRLFYAYGALNNWSMAAQSLVTLVQIDADWTKLKIALDLVDGQNGPEAISKYRANVLPHIAEPARSDIEAWLEDMERGLVMFSLN